MRHEGVHVVFIIVWVDDQWKLQWIQVQVAWDKPDKQVKTYDVYDLRRVLGGNYNFVCTA